MNMPDQQLAQSWPQVAQQIDSIPGNKIKLDPQQPMTKQQLGQFGPFLSLNDAYLQSEMAKRQEKAKTSSAESDAVIKAQQAQMAQSGGGAVGTGLDVQEANAWLRKNPGKDLADYQKYKATMVPAFRFNLNQGAAGAGGEANDDDLARGMVDGTVDVTKLASIRSGRREALVSKAMQLDPTFSMATYPQRLRVQEKFSSGKAADQISSLNTFAGHIADASDLVDSLRNSNSPWINAPMNKVAVGLGNDKIGPFQAALEAAKDEYLSFLKGGHAPQQQELALADKLVSANQTPAQIQAVLKQMTNTILIRAGSLNSEYARTMHKDYPMLSQESVAALAKLGFGDRAQKFAAGGEAGSNSPAPTASDPFAAFEGKARRIEHRSNAGPGRHSWRCPAAAGSGCGQSRFQDCR